MPLFIPATLSLASAPGDKRVIVIILRGAMDGLHLLQPIGDKNFQKLRPTLSKTDEKHLVEVNGLYALNTTDTGDNFQKLWHESDLSFIQAVSTPYRGTRSHFDGQDILETGGSALGDQRSGWLARMVEVVGPSKVGSAFTVSSNGMLLGQGDKALDNHSPGTYLPSDITNTDMLSELYQGDRLFMEALTKASKFEKLESAQISTQSMPLNNADTAIENLNGESRIAAFSIGGWDTHSSQTRSISAPLKALASVLTRLKHGLGPNWLNTSIICITEFGRTVRENGVGGTDHGTGGMAILSGGAIIGQQIHGHWPGLSAKSLYEDRDLLPTSDIRHYISRLFSETYNTRYQSIANKVFNIQESQRTSNTVVLTKHL